VHDPANLESAPALQPTGPAFTVSGTMTHDYKGCGTNMLFVALNVLDATGVGRCMSQHYRQKFIKFLNAVKRTVLAGRIIHAILDYYAPTSTPRCRPDWPITHAGSSNWLRYAASASWLSAVEGFFSTLNRKRMKRGVSIPVPEFEGDSRRFIKEHKGKARLSVWTNPPRPSWRGSGSYPVHPFNESVD
jgi:hypothetical protein